MYLANRYSELLMYSTELSAGTPIDGGIVQISFLFMSEWCSGFSHYFGLVSRKWTNDPKEPFKLIFQPPDPAIFRFQPLSRKSFSGSVSPKAHQNRAGSRASRTMRSYPGVIEGFHGFSAEGVAFSPTHPPNRKYLPMNFVDYFWRLFFGTSRSTLIHGKMVSLESYGIRMWKRHRVCRELQQKHQKHHQNQQQQQHPWNFESMRFLEAPPGLALWGRLPALWGRLGARKVFTEQPGREAARHRWGNQLLPMFDGWYTCMSQDGS